MWITGTQIIQSLPSDSEYFVRERATITYAKSRFLELGLPAKGSIFLEFPTNYIWHLFYGGFSDKPKRYSLGS